MTIRLRATTALLAVALALMLLAPASPASAAATDAISRGRMVVNTSTSRFLPVTATGDACLTANAGNVGAPATNYVGNFGAPVGCTNVFSVPSANQPSIFRKFFNLVPHAGYEGATGAPKFPAPVSRGASLSVLDGPVGNDTLAVSNGGFGSNQFAVGNVVLLRSATLQSDATVTRNGAMSPTGTATSYTYDPWLFTPLEDIELSLRVTLEDVTVRATGQPGQEGAAIFQAFGAFGHGAVPGVDTLQTWREGSFIGATGNGMLTIGSRTVFDNTADPFRLHAGQTYWLTAATLAGAVAAVPEPSSFVLAALGLAGMILMLTWRRVGSTGRGRPRRRVRRLGQGAAAAVALAVGLVHAADPDAGYTYDVQAKHSNRVLDVTGGTAALGDGIAIQQYDLLGPNQTNQRFRLVREDDGFYTLRPQHSGKCAEVTGGVAAIGNGAKVVQSECNGRDNQRWRLRELDGGFFRLDAKHSNKSLDVEGGPAATGNGVKLQQWDWLDGDNQKFRFVERSKSVVCVAPSNDGFVSQGEGFERVGLGAADQVHNGGALRDCLAQVGDGDNLVIVAHGNKGFFDWGNS